MKKNLLIGIIVFSLVLCFGLIGCGSGDTATTDVVDKPAKVVEKEETPAEAKYAVTIDSARTATDYDGNPVIVVTFSWVNNSDKTISFAVACMEQAFQDGVQLEYAYIPDINNDGEWADVRPGAGTTFEKAYKTTKTVVKDDKIGRNEPCPCGSGKKYKNCCGR